MKTYTYMHIRRDTGKPFYIGKGSDGRAWDLRAGKRGSHWSNVAKKAGVDVVILAHWGSDQEAFEHEIFLIRTFREIGIPLVNKTIGGEGTSGYKLGPERCAAISAAAKARYPIVGNPMQGKKHTPETLSKLRAAKVGKYVGSKHPKATITEASARAIFLMRGLMSSGDLSRTLDISIHIVRNIWSLKSWRHVNGSTT